MCVWEEETRRRLVLAHPFQISRLDSDDAARKGVGRLRVDHQPLQQRRWQQQMIRAAVQAQLREHETAGLLLKADHLPSTVIKGTQNRSVIIAG